VHGGGDQGVFGGRARGGLGDEGVDGGVRQRAEQARKQAVASEKRAREAKSPVGKTVEAQQNRKAPRRGGKAGAGTDPVGQAAARGREQQEGRKLQRLVKADLGRRKARVEGHVPHQKDGLETLSAVPEAVGPEETAAHAAPLLRATLTEGG
jgi:hypothetical protein